MPLFIYLFWGGGGGGEGSLEAGTWGGGREALKLVFMFPLEEDEVKNFIHAGYREIYETSHLFSTKDLEIENFSYCFLFDEEKGLLNNTVTEEEIRQGL